MRRLACLMIAALSAGCGGSGSSGDGSGSGSPPNPSTSSAACLLDARAAIQATEQFGMTDVGIFAIYMNWTGWVKLEALPQFIIVQTQNCQYYVR